jgi:hypothetical protein
VENVVFWSYNRLRARLLKVVETIPNLMILIAIANEEDYAVVQS